MSSSEFQLDPDTPVLNMPRTGTPDVLTVSEDIAAAGIRLAAGYGPLAVDTERASAYRYGDRAFLLQLRRAGAGTFLIDCEANRTATETLAEYINPLTWTLHAAPSDLPCLAEMGLYPASLQDTEMAGKLLGLSRVSLAALTEQFLGVGLAKGHGREDWSFRPLPQDWIDYAALDVELLNELCGALLAALAEQDRDQWFEQECEHIRRYFNPVLNPPEPASERWRSMKGYGKLKRPSQLVVARAVWNERDRIARQRDVCVPQVLSHAAVASIAEDLPKNIKALSSIKGFPRRRRGAAQQWLAVVKQALDEPQETWPTPASRRSAASDRIHHRHWLEAAPEAAKLYDAFSDTLRIFSASESIRPEAIMTTSELRDLAWWSAEEFPKTLPTAVPPNDRLPSFSQLYRHLEVAGKRPWQASLISELLSQQVFAELRWT